MSAPPLLGLVAGLALFPDAPDGVVCWGGWLRDHPAVGVNILLEAQPVERLDLEFIDHVCADHERLLAVAALASGLSGDGSGGGGSGDGGGGGGSGDGGGGGGSGDGEWAGWGPELTFWVGREWAVRFAEAQGPGGVGVMVFFDGERIVEVDDMAEWD